MSVLQAHMQSSAPQLQSVGVAGASVAAAAVEPSAVVVGAGCCGLAVALQLLYAGQRVVVLTKDTTPRTTSDAAGALWRPFGEVSDANRAVFSRWGKETFDFLNQLRLTHGSPATGIMLVSGFEVFSAAQAEPFWARDVLNFRMLNEEELRQVGLPAHKHGFSYTSIIIDMDVYMRWMHREFYRVGGKLHIHELRHLREARSLYPSARVLVNCTGLGAGELVRDTSVFPVAGHIVKMRLPGVHHFFMDAEAQPNPTYIFPRAHDVVVGGSYFKRDANTRPSIQTREDILARAARFVPEIATAPITAEYVGLRPYRDVTRLELDEAADAGLPVIHNYGHGGSGVTLHWGCGVTVMELAAKFLPPPTEKVHPQPVGAHVPSKL